MVPGAVEQGFPAVHGAGHGYGQRAGGRHPAMPFGVQVGDAGGGGRASAAVEGSHLPPVGLPDEGEQVAASARGHRFHYIERGGGSHGGVHGVAPIHQDAQAGHSGQGLAGGDNAAGGVDGGTAGVEKHRACSGRWGRGNGGGF